MKPILISLLLASASVPAVKGQLQAEVAFPNLKFERPVDFESDRSGRLYVVEQFGKIYTFPNDRSVGEASLFLDVADRVLGDENFVEAGLLGLALHPDYEANGYFYVYYVADDPLRSVLARFERSADDPMRADPGSEHVLLTFPQPDDKHNAGDLTFGRDGYLYVSVGDGGYFEDHIGKAYSQDLSNLYGSILRIDVDRTSGAMPYAIPPDNPFADNDEGYREEIYAYGFRNPWRFSIDPETGGLWVGDVGEETWEEINYVRKGENAGWPIMEGPECFIAEACDASGLVEPTFAYEHGDMGRSVTGGFVYRGEALPALRGTYVFADWNSQKSWALERVDGEPAVGAPLDTERFISSFGEDADGELYFTSYFHEGHVFRIAGYTPTSPEELVPGEARTRLALVGPNPFRHATSLTLETDEDGPAQVRVYDVTGRHVADLFDGPVISRFPQTVHFDAGGLAPGVYFCRLTFGGEVVHTQPVVLAR